MLEKIDNYLTEAMNTQDLNAKTMMQLANKFFRWYDWLTIIFMTITYSTNFLKRIFKNTHINYVIKFTTRFNFILCEFGLGTIPIINHDEQYLSMYSNLVHLESGLPAFITVKIHRPITSGVNSIG